MKKLDEYIQSNPGKVFYILLLLAVPAFFINPGLLPLFADEPTRANVALEMILSHNYSVPTIGSDFYYNKPALYNWLLAGCYLITGSYSEFITRLPTLVPLFLFAITIYYSTAYFLKDKRVALVSGIFSLVYGRILVYDSLLGEIDIFFSWLTYLSFTLIFYFYQRGQWFKLFLISYIITAITFLLKGLPALVFQGLTIITLLVYTKNLKKLFSWQHIVSGLCCAAIVGVYFYNYHFYNNNLPAYFYELWHQSSERTLLETNKAATLVHLLVFPFDILYQILPAGLLVIFCFHKEFIRGIKHDPFLKYISLIFLMNALVYWFSPQTRPRYIFSLYPLVIIILTHAYYNYRNKFPSLQKVFNIILLVAACFVTLSIPAALFTDLKFIINSLFLQVAIISISCAFLTWCIYQSSAYKLIYLLALMIMIKLSFNCFVLPYRNAYGDYQNLKIIGENIGYLSKKTPVYLYRYHPDILSLPDHHKLIFYIEKTRMKPVKFSEVDSLPGYYFTFDKGLKNPSAKLVRSYSNKYKLFKVQ